ncbi:MAG: 30S ribosome-binding factor RbfA [Patescibacteria group bacterium]
MSERIIRINELILQQLGQVIREELELPLGSLVTILQVKTSPDLKYSQALISVLPDDQSEKILKILNSHTHLLQTALNDKISLRSIPKLQFALDQTEQKASEIERLLDQLQ